MNPSNSRRNFFKQVTLGGAALMLSPAVFRAFGTPLWNIPANSGLLPAAVVEDAFDLAFTLPDMSNTSKIALAGDINLKIPGNKGRLAPAVVIKKEAIVGVLDKIKNATADDKNISQDKLSFLYGILCNNILRQNLQAVYQKYPDESEELSMYQDTYLLSMLAGKEAERVKQENLEHLLKVLLPRTITRVHTLIPDSKDGPGWVVKMGQWRKDNFARMERYARAYTHPEADKVKKYIKDVNFYNAEDNIIRLSRKIQNGERVGEQALRNGLDAAKRGSLYSQTLAEGVRHIEMVDKFLTESIDSQQLTSALKV